MRPTCAACELKELIHVKTRRTAPGVFERFINARSVTTIINLILLTAQRRHSGVILWV